MNVHPHVLAHWLSHMCTCGGVTLDLLKLEYLQAPSLSPCVWPGGSLTVPLCVAGRLPHCPLVCGREAPSLSPCVWSTCPLSLRLCCLFRSDAGPMALNGSAIDMMSQQRGGVMEEYPETPLHSSKCGDGGREGGGRREGNGKGGTGGRMEEIGY